MKLIAARFVALAVLCLFAAGCPKSESEGGPMISSFTSSASSVAPGATVTLSWRTERANAIVLEELRSGVKLEASETEGSLDVTVTGDSLFLLTAVNARGAIERSALSVLASSSAPSVSLYAVPAEIAAGEEATLAWSAVGATEVVITAEPGGPVDLAGQLESGTVVVRPSRTTVYSLQANGGTATASVTVGPQIISFAATPAVANRGAPLTLAWETRGADEVVLFTAGREALRETDAAKVGAGTWAEDIPAVVSPGTVYTYRLIARSASGASVERLLEVSVDGVAAVTSFTAPKYARRGGQLTLSWTTVQAESLSLSAGGAEFYQAPALASVASGSVTIPAPSADTEYTVTASNSRGGVDARTLKVISVGAPVIHAFAATPMQVNAAQPVTLSWTTESAPNVSIREAIDGELFRAADAPNTGSATLYPSQTATYTLVADNGFGETATATLAPVTVLSPVLLTPSLPGTVSAGASVDLSWTLPGPITGLPHSIIDLRSSSGFDDIQPTGARLIFTAKDDDSAALPTLNFRTTLFGKSVGSDVVVSTNGYMVFGRYLDRFNSIPVALPTSKIEPLAIAPFWADLEIGAVGGVYWQIKGTPEDPVLIVQWDRLWAGNLGPYTFQARIHSSGRVDFDYRDIPSGASIPNRAGVQGPDPRWGLGAPTNPSTENHLTFFGPKTSPVTVTPVVAGTFSGTITVGSNPMRLSHVFTGVVDKNELIFTEAMPLPHASLGAAGQWLELSNFTPAALDLTGWQLGLADGGSLPLSGTIPGNGRLVIGASTNPAANGDAGVQLALPGFALSSGAEALSLGRGAPLSSFAWSAAPGAATAVVQDPGPFRFSTDSVTGPTSVPRSQVCAASQAWSSSPLQLGTPGRTAGCGFGYFMSRIPAGFHDISTTGTARLSAGSFDNAIVQLDVSAAQFPFFGTFQTKLYVSTNGFITTDSAVRPTDYVSWFIPANSAPNGVMAPLSADLAAMPGVGQLYTRRVAANEDPFASAPHWTVQWAHFGVPGAGDDFNFQIKLFDDGAIEYHYAELRSGNIAFNGAGGYSSSWLENPAGTQAIVINAQTISPGLAWHSAFRFTPGP